MEILKDPTKILSIVISIKTLNEPTFKDKLVGQNEISRFKPILGVTTENDKADYKVKNLLNTLYKFLGKIINESINDATNVATINYILENIKILAENDQKFKEYLETAKNKKNEIEKKKNVDKLLVETVKKAQTVDWNEKKRVEEEARRVEEEARRVEEEARRVKEEELKKANEDRDKFARNYSVNKIKEEMKEIIKKIKKNSDAIDFDDTEPTKIWISNKKRDGFKLNPLVQKYKNIEKWLTSENLIEEAKEYKQIDNDAFNKVRFKNFIDNVSEFEENAEIKEPILSSEQETEDYWKKLYDESKTYAQNHLWWREVFLGNIRS